MTPDWYATSPYTPEQAAERDRVLGALAQRTRALMDAQLRTDIDLAEAEKIADELAALTERLLDRATPGPLGIEIGQDGSVRNPGNAVVGLRNPVAPPLDVVCTPDGRGSARFHLNALYEGPPGLVHGGVSALILDQVLGQTANTTGVPGMTGRLSLSYLRPTPLGDLSVEAWIESSDGVKTTVRGHIQDPQGRTTVEAEGLFIVPRAVREAIARGEARPPRFE